MTSPKLICAGVGLKPYLPAGISSAAATRLVPGALGDRTEGIGDWGRGILRRGRGREVADRERDEQK